jgi:hypothetical protein
VEYATPMFSDVDNQLCVVFKTIVKDFSSDEEEGKDSYPQKDQCFFFVEEMHEVLFYDGGQTVKVAPSLCQVQSFL